MPRTDMQHDNDPRQEILDKVKPHLADVEHLFHSQILVAIYKRSEKTSGGIFIPQQALDEDLYQGKSGLVIMKGPRAFVDTDDVKFYGQNVEVGDWVAYRASDGWPIKIGEMDCRILQDAAIKLKIARPDLTW